MYSRFIKSSEKFYTVVKGRIMNKRNKVRNFLLTYNYVVYETMGRILDHYSKAILKASLHG